MFAAKSTFKYRLILLLFFSFSFHLISAQTGAEKADYNTVLNQAEKLYFEKNYTGAKAAFQQALQLRPAEKHPQERITEINNILGITDPSDGRYNSLVSEADNLYQQEKWQQALDKYIAANDLNPGQDHATSRILELNAMIKHNENLEKDYNSLIKFGLAYFESKQYEQAKTEFQKALQLKPGEAVPKEKIAEIDRYQNNKAEYEEAVARADELYINLDYQKARTAYQQAQQIKKDEAYPGSMISRIDESIAKREGETLQRRQAYDAALADADAFFDQKNYADALPQYQEASRLMPEENYPKVRITEATRLMEQMAATDEQYMQALADGKNYEEAGNDKAALAAYTTASNLKPDEEFPRNKVSELQSKIGIAETDAAYASAIASADQAFAADDFASAKSEYQKAAGLKPDETYPKTRIKEIETLLSSLAETDAAYTSAIVTADQAFAAENYASAKSEYQKAVGLKPDETYPQTRISEIETLLSSLAETDAAYASAIAAADQAFAGEDFASAKSEYQKAAGLKPDETYPKTKISEIETLLSSLAETDAAYASAIASADQAFAAQEYPSAKAEYQKAAGLKPDETYPKTRIKEIETLLSSLAETDAAYTSAIAAADQAFAAQEYPSAKAEYQKAAGLKPDETYPKTKISEIETLLSSLAETDAAYTSAIATADQAFAAEEYASAKSEYQKASGLKPDETYPKTRISEIETLLASLAETDAAYTSAIAAADQAFAAEEYASAKAEYQKAAGLKPDETYPKTRISEIETLLSSLAETDAAYTSAIAAADQAFAAQEYSSAKAEYQKASGLKPNETYPKTKISEIETLLSSLAETDAAYTSAIATADQAFAAEDFASAKSEYQKAAGLKPDETYPKTRITEIETLLASLAETDAAYTTAIAAADQAFAAEDYISAKAEYQKASGLKPDETYPKTRISEIETLLSSLAETDAAYTSAIAAADQAFAAEDFASAKMEYQKAAGLKPDETYPKTKISEIETLLSSLAETDAAYTSAIAAADQAFAGEDFASAKIEYQKASGLKPDETYPQTRISEIETLLSSLAETDAAYTLTIAAADQAFAAEDYASAKAKFQIAAGLKPDEAYPKTRISEIETLLSSLAETDAAYTSAIAAADQAFAAQEYPSAKAEYQKAAGLKPDETYPKTRISEIETLLSSLAETDAAYTSAIAAADQAFALQEYSSAKAEYQKASGLKPDETYPKTRITEIETLLSSLAETDAAYTSAIAAADQAFAAEDFASAKMEYQKAAGLKPEETYPKTRISEIDNLLSSLAETDAAYTSAIAAADQAFALQEYPSAKAEYQKASGLKPEETYPKTRISEIETLLSSLAETDAAYTSAIAAADQAFAAQEYPSAKAEYQKASGLKPDETYPKTRITEIETLMASLAETDAAYTSAIATADQAFAAEEYASAKSEYQKAAGLKPNETYPKTRISEIEALLSSLAETDAAYTSVIATADQSFAAENYASAKSEYQKAAGLKPNETYPKTRISEIETLLSSLAETDAAYTSAIAAADQAFAAQEYPSAKAEYQKASGLKPNETYPKTKISEIETLLSSLAAQATALAQKQEEYQTLIKTADFHFDAANYEKSKAAYKQAAAIFPQEAYPTQRITEIDAVLAAAYEKVRQEYNAVIRDADRYFDQKIYDNAIQSYMAASKILPTETYPNERIRQISKIIEANVVVDVVKSIELLDNNTLKRYDFQPVPRQGRKESYVVVKARNTSGREFKLFLNYGKGDTKNGGFVINIPEADGQRDYIVKVGGQYKWFSEDNDWISLQPEGGSAEISLIQISQE